VVVDFCELFGLSVLLSDYFSEGLELADGLVDVDAGIDLVDQAEPEYFQGAGFCAGEDGVAEPFGEGGDSSCFLDYEVDFDVVVARACVVGVDVPEYGDLFGLY
jgi:hypothetical protein